jgi:hypothetical protein
LDLYLGVLASGAELSEEFTTHDVYRMANNWRRVSAVRAAEGTRLFQQAGDEWARGFPVTAGGVMATADGEGSSLLEYVPFVDIFFAGRNALRACP